MIVQNKIQLYKNSYKSVDYVGFIANNNLSFQIKDYVIKWSSSFLTIKLSVQ